MKSVRAGARAWAVLIVVFLAVGVGPASSGTPPVGGLNLIFKHVCASTLLHWGNCGAIVAATADGTPLAGTTPPVAALGPAQFHSAYNLPTSAAGSETIGIVDAYDDPNIESDLAAYDSYYGLPACTTANGCFRKVNQTGGTTYPASNASWSLEISLDVETAHEICQNCKILLVEGTSAQNSDLGIAENEAAALGANVISNSFISSEYSTETADEAAYFHHPGIAIVAASGDNGAAAGFPAASRYVVAVGGTTLTLNSAGGYGSETAWSGSGGGCSRYIPKPAWQHDTRCAMRTENDVAADADPNTGAAVFDTVPYSGQTGWFQVGGTSLATPLIAATYALAGNTGAVDDASGIYAHAASLHDITSGRNGFCSGYLCVAGVGYDSPTGLGTPNGLGAFGGSSTTTPDFSLSASPSSQTVTQGQSTTYTIGFTPSGGFSSSAALSVTGLPTGANGSFSPTSVTSSNPSSTLTVTTSATVATGSYPLTITGTGGGTSHSVPATFVVQSSVTPDFSLGVSPAANTVTAGAGTTYTVSLTRTGGFTGNVALSASGLPSAATAGFNPSAITTGSSSTLTITTAATLGAASYPFTITGTSGGLTHSIPATLVVQGSGSGQSGDFSISISPSSRSIPSTGTSTYTVTITPTGGFDGPVSLSVQSPPRGIAASFSPNPASSTSTLTLVTSGFFSFFPIRLTIVGTSGTITHTTTLTLSTSFF